MSTSTHYYIYKYRICIYRILPNRCLFIYRNGKALGDRPRNSLQRQVFSLKKTCFLVFINLKLLQKGGNIIFFQKKVLQRFVQLRKRSYLCTRFPKGRHEIRSLTDCEQKKDKQRICTLYIINICTSDKSFLQKTKTNNRAGKPGRSDRTIMK